MFAKFFQKATATKPPPPQGRLRSVDFDPCITLHYGIPATASILAFDPIQRLLAVGTLDGRIKVIGGDNVEGLLVSPKKLPFKYLEFLQNQGFLASVSNGNEIQVWDLENSQITSNLKWESNITAFSVIHGTSYMYIGDEYGMVFVIKYDAEEGKLIHMSYYVPTDVIAEAAGVSSPNHHSVVGVLPQPCSQGNRLLIAYGNGLIVVWDVSEDQVVILRGNKDIQLKDKTISNSGEKFDEPLEKEISSLCWASNDGSILAVGYVDGDVLFWNLSTAAPRKDKQSEKSLNNVVKLQLSSGNKRFPVIVLHSSTRRFPSNQGCQLFVYGGDEIGSKEVLKILSLEWSCTLESLKCVNSVDLTLNGSFANMVFSPGSGMESSDSLLFLLTNPGKLDVYDDASISALLSKQEKRIHVSSIHYSMPIPTVDPHMTVCKLGLVDRDEELSKALSKIVSAAKFKAMNMPKTKSTHWPLTGGIPSLLSEASDDQIERVYAAGYKDGSVRIWDATCPALSLIFVIGSEVEGINIAAASASVSALDICSFTLSLATGNECGMFTNCTKQMGLNARLCFPSSVPLSLVSSLAVQSFSDTMNIENCSKDSVPKGLDDHDKWVIFLMTKDAHFSILDGISGNVIKSHSRISQMESSAVSMYIIEGDNIICELPNEKHSLKPSQILESKSEPAQSDTDHGIIPSEGELESNDEVAYLGQMSNLLILFCFEDALHFYSMESLIQGYGDSVQKVNLSKPCCWTATLSKDEKECGLVLLYQTGDLEIRSLTTLDVVGESSLMSIVGWSLKTNIEKTICSSNRGQIMLVNGCEFASISILASKNDFRITDSLPCLHDKVLAAAFDATANISQSQKKSQDAAPGILGGIIKGLKGGKVDNVDLSEACTNDFSHLERIFSNPPFLKPTEDAREVKELNLNIDDINIDESIVISSSYEKIIYDREENATERERLFEGATAVTKPELRTPDEIRAKYRGTEDAAAAAARTKDRLLERKEKLQRLDERTQELQSGAESFASMANELAKRMERRKWWQI
ncbi:hypothetical protein SLEP1_g5901 [Rubroshorea leprosula]|uniref:V-SNARE coiled-coil homology domain-containing protein n=1 Tax=Rubroshorea leprosula TaxID=152421 RepID=A0AAV5HTS5_9ROSI|nr:hypothetical protein SLEP1_g5901 [Rubroshorea leprosula]